MSETQPPKEQGTAGSACSAVVRRPLAPGNIYQFKGFPTKVLIKGMALPGTPFNDGGLPGVAVKWLDNNNNSLGWFPFESESEFWADFRFRNLVDPDNA